MQKYTKNTIGYFPIKIEKYQAVASLATENIFKVKRSKPLNKNKQELFHTTLTIGLFLCKRNISDIQPTITVLCTRVKHPNQGDWKKILRLMKYLVGTQELCFTLKADKTTCLKWYVDVAFAVHYSFKLYTGATLTMGKGAIVSV